MAEYSKVMQCVLEGDDETIAGRVQELLDGGVAPMEVLQEGLIAGMNEVGRLFREEDLFLPEVLMAADAMKAGVAVVHPLLNGETIEVPGTVIIGTVKGDLHDIGKNIVGMMLETAGFKVINLGFDVPPQDFCDKVRETGAEIVGMSSLLTTSMMQMETTIKLLQEQGLRSKVKVIIGGAPTSQEFAEKIGADGFSADALAAVELCKRLVGA